MMVVNDLVFRLLRKNATLLGVPDMSSRWLERWPSAFGWAGNNRTLRGATGPAVGPAVATVGFRPFRIRSASHNAGKSNQPPGPSERPTRSILAPDPRFSYQTQTKRDGAVREKQNSTTLSRKTKRDDAIREKENATTPFAKNKTQQRRSRKTKRDAAVREKQNAMTLF